MKGILKKSAALILVCMIILSSCSNKAGDDGAISDPSENTLESVPSDHADGDSTAKMLVLSENLSSEIKERYKDQEEVEYQEPLFNLPADNKFIIELGFDPNSSDKYYAEGDNGKEYKPIVDVFIDSDFKISVSPEYKTSSKSNKIQLQPNKPARDPDAGYELFSSNSNWGYANQYYIVQFLDYETGEELQKPKVTVFTIDRPMNPPQLKFEKTADGYATYSWTAVEGAEAYLLTYLQDDHTSIFDGMELGTIKDTSYTHVTNTILNDNVDHVVTNFYYNEILDFSGVVVYAIDSEGNYSLASNELSIDSFRYLLPASINLEKTATAYEDYNSVPNHVFVRMCDGTSVEYPIGLDIENAEIVNFKEKDDLDKDTFLLRIPYIPEGTNIETFIAIRSYNEDTLKEDLESLKERTLAGKSVAGAPAPPEITIGSTPPADDPKSSEPEPSKPESSEPEPSKPEPSEPEPSKPESSEPEPSGSSGNSSNGSVNEKFTVEIDGYKVYGSNALTAYIAYNLLQGEEAINLSEFPETSNTDVIFDSLLEAWYQNPLALGLVSMNFNPITSTLIVKYKQDKAELFQKQKEINEKVDQIVSEIIDVDMTDIEKEFAINQYLCDNVEYDFDALDNAMENDFIPDNSFRDSFTPYGALINNVGVCASYASAFKLLADEAGLDAIVAVGYLNGDLPHAWNRVYLDGEWLSVDSTNNDNEQTPNFLLNLPDQIAASMLVEDGMHIVDSRIDEFTSSNDEYEYYRYMGLYFEPDEIGIELAKTYMKNGFAVYRTDENITSEEFTNIQKDIIVTLISEGIKESEFEKIGMQLSLGTILLIKGE